jgi:hypothetical protein
LGGGSALAKMNNSGYHMAMASASPLSLPCRRPPMGSVLESQGTPSSLPEIPEIPEIPEMIVVSRRQQ